MDRNNFGLLLLVIVGGFTFCYIALHKIEAVLQECLLALNDLDAIKGNMESAAASLEAIEQRINPKDMG
jgi:hypothetical protein